MPVPAPVPAFPSRFLLMRLAGSSLFVECVEKHFANIDSELRVEFAHARWTGHVDLRELSGDHVEAGELYAVFHQHGSDDMGDSQFVIVDRLSLAAPAARKVAAEIGAAGDAREHVRHRFAVNHKDPLVAV